MPKKTLIFIISILLLSGCATTKETPPVELVETKVEKVEPPEAPLSKDLQNVKGEELEEYIKKNGVVFAKTDFSGVLKTTYVKLLFEHQDNSEDVFQIFIGDKSQKPSILHNVKTVKPGYFFIELPEGEYTISSISIPVGTTLATEETNVTFSVVPDSIVYIGTLKVVGTKEKIKLGGVPVIKPGFEYSIEIIDESKEAEGAFRQRYPDVPNDIVVQLMQLNPQE